MEMLNLTQGSHTLQFRLTGPKAVLQLALKMRNIPCVNISITFGLLFQPLGTRQEFVALPFMVRDTTHALAHRMTWHAFGLRQMDTPRPEGTPHGSEKNM